MSCNLKQINDVKDIQPIPISLPNGTHTLAAKKGMVTLGQGGSLKDVLLVHELYCNILSVAELCKDLKCTVIFFDDSYVLQDHTSRTPIGVGEQRDGVYYYLGASKKKHQVNAVGTRSLWHHRFGHPSHEAMSVFFRNLRIRGGNKDVCDICFKAKQTRSRFIISNNKASALFELTHCDIWGPYRGHI